MGFLKYIVIIFILISTVASLYSSGTSSGETLKEIIGARPAGMGGAFVAISDDTNSLQYNPAGLARIDKFEISAMYLKNYLDTKGTFLGTLIPLKFGTFGLSMVLFDGGEAEIYSSDGSIKNIKAQMDYIITLGSGIKLYQNLFLGLNVKYFYSILAEESQASSMITDFGLLYNLWKFGIGLAYQNMGQKVIYKGGISTGNTPDNLPQTLRLGICYKLDITGNIKSNISTDIEKVTEEKNYRINNGVEIIYNDLLSIRVGYKSGSDTESFSLGLGFIFKYLKLDYAFLPVTNLDNLHRFSLSYMFSREKNIVETDNVRQITKENKKEINIDSGNEEEVNGNETENKITISLYITDIDEEPLGNVAIKFFRDKELLLNTISDKNGKYKIENLEKGEYLIKLWKQGYIAKSEEVTVSGNNKLKFVLNEK